MQIAFSVLTYRPSYIANEKINIGILFYDEERNDVYFELTTNWARIRNFDDEIDIDTFKLILDGMKSHAERNVRKIGIENYIKRYNNELKFGKVFYKNTMSINEFILETKQVFMRYDFEKKNRPTKEKQLKYIKGVIKDSGIKYSTKTITGNHNENINYDYIIANYGFKLFEFENKKDNRIISTAKNWAYTARELKEDYNTIFIYDIDKDDDVFKSTMSILKSSGAQVMNKEEVLSFILKLHQVYKQVEFKM